MSTEQSYDSSTFRPKKSSTNHQPAGNSSHPGPTTFFLKSEKEMEESAQRGRKGSRPSNDGLDASQSASAGSLAGDSTFGVQSLEDTISSAFSSDSVLRRTASNSSDASTENRSNGGTPIIRKRKAGNPVHPKILATGQRIISSERVPLQEFHNSSPTSFKSSNSPSRTSRPRRGSVASSINISQPMTPVKISPHPEMATPSTPRSASPKSFRLSDEECSVADETNSQAVASSSGEEEEGTQASERMPQLVMPSLSMPVRRPFTEEGRNMGRARFMLIGPKGVGKTSFIHSIFRSSAHIVHVDPAASETSQTSLAFDGSVYQGTAQTTEITASTRPYPLWWSGENLRLSRSRKSFGDGILERNLTFIDTPGIQEERDAQDILDYFRASLQRSTDLDGLSATELIDLFSGDGGLQIDAVIYIFNPISASGDAHSSPLCLGPAHQELLQYLCRCTNFIPLIGRADTITAEAVSLRKDEIVQFLQSIEALPYKFDSTKSSIAGSAGDSGIRGQVPYAISSAIGDDMDVIDASLLMSSQYMPPLVPSELPQVVDELLSPTNLRKMRRLAASKLITWREASRKSRRELDPPRGLLSPRLDYESPRFASTGSLLEEASKVLVPQGSSSYYRSASPSISEVSGLSSPGVRASAYALAKYNEQIPPSEPFRQVRLAKWAQDLQRSLHNESRRYREMYQQRPAEWSSEDDSEKQDGHALVSTRDPRRPARGRLGGDLGVIDPRDPLGVLALAQNVRRHGLFAIQIAGSCGLLGAMAFWVVKHWMDVQEFFGFGQPLPMMHVAAVPPPPKSMLGWLDESHLRSFFAWARAKMFDHGSMN